MSEDWIAGLLATLIVLFAMSALLQLRQQQLRFRFEQEDRYKRQALQDYQMTLEAEKSTSKGSDRLSSRVIAELDLRIRELEAAMNQLDRAIGDEHPGQDRGTVAAKDRAAAKILRQLSHSMGTPLSRIKADALAMSDGSHRDVPLQRIVTAVDLVNAYLTAYRQLAAIGDRGGIFDDASLHRSVWRICQVYSTGSATSPTVEIVLPSSIPGFTNTFLIAVMAPLIENSFEACPSDGQILVEYSADPVPTIRLRNTYLGPALPQDVMTEGRSTKDGHEGLGLSTAATLLSSRAGAELSLVEAEREVTAMVVLREP